MADQTKISWTDSTFNPWIGCTKVAPGCAHCYAEHDMDHRRGRAKWGQAGTRSRTSDSNWTKPIGWNAKAIAEGRRHRVFCASLCDIFENWQGPIVDHNGEQIWVADVEPGRYCTLPAGGMHFLTPQEKQNIDAGIFRRATMDDLRGDLFRLIDRTPAIDWQLLTKRPENISRMWPGSRRENVWLGTSVSEQESANRNIPILLKHGDLSPVLFASAEPLLGPIDFTQIRNQGCGSFDALDGRNWDESEPGGKSNYAIQPIDWIILGGESGPQSRACNADWILAGIQQCAESACACFVKQFGENAINLPPNPESLLDHWLIDRKGGNPEEWPRQFCVQQFPQIA